MKKVWRALNNLSPSDTKLMNLPRQPNGLHNMHFNEYGEVEKRAGFATHGSSLGTGHKIVGMHRYYRDSDKVFLVAWSSGIYHSTRLLQAVTADSDTYFADFDGRSYFVNGVDGVFKCTYDDEIAGTRTSGTIFTRTAGTWIVDALIDQYVFSYVNTDPTTGTWTKIADNDSGTITITGSLHASANRIRILIVRSVGITVPIAATKNSLIDGSLGTGDYKYRITYVDENGYESNGGTSVTIAAEAHANDGIRLNIPVSSDKKITKRRIYRTALDGAIYYYDGEVTDNSTTTYDSTKADGSLVSILHTNYTAPPTTSHLITKRRNKLYLAYGGYLYPSYTSDVEYFPPLWRLRTGNSQKIMGLLEQLTALPVTTEDSIERLVGTDEDNFEYRNSYSTEGCLAIRSYVNCDNLLVYLGFNGINYFDGVSSGIFSEALNEYIKDNIVDDYRHLSCATYFNNKYILCYPKTGGTYPTETVWYDLKNRTYGVYSFAFSCFSIWNRGSDGLQLKGGSNTIGQVYSVFSGLDDGGSDIEAYDQIDFLDFGIPEREKTYYKIYVRCAATTSTTLTVYYQTDIDTEASVTATLTANKDLWYEINLPGEVKGRAIKVRPRVSDKYDITFKGIMIQYDVEELRI